VSHQGKLRNAIGFALLALACTWPYFETLGFWPMTGDPALWIGRGTAVDPDWFSWVFLGDHFSWYRPLAALSFTLDHALGGLNPLVYRLTDMGLHIAAGYLVLRLGRVLAPHRATWLAWVAAAIFMAHPGSDEVVPFMARRSYSLATVFGLSALCLLDQRPAGPGRARLLETGCLLAAALLTNEAAIVLVPVALSILWRNNKDSTGRRVGATLACALVSLPVVAALCLRTVVLVGLGGYGGDAVQATGAVESLLSMWTTLTGLDWLAAMDGPTGLHLGNALIGLTAVYFLVHATRSGSDASDSRRPGTPLIITLWLIGYAVLILWSGLWVERQVYFLQAPFAWLATLLVASAIEKCRGGPLTLALRLAPPLFILGCVFCASPVVRGQREARMEGWRERQQLLTHIEEDLASLEGPACVHTVLPNMRRRFRTQSRGGQGFVHQSIRHPFSWSRVLVRRRDITISDWVYFDRAHGVPSLLAEPLPDGRAGLVLPAGGEYLVRPTPLASLPFEWIVWAPGFARRNENSPRVLAYDDLKRTAGRPCYVYVASPSGGELQRIPD